MNNYTYCKEAYRPADGGYASPFIGSGGSNNSFHPSNHDRLNKAIFERQMDAGILQNNYSRTHNNVPYSSSRKKFQGITPIGIDVGNNPVLFTFPTQEFDCKRLPQTDVLEVKAVQTNQMGIVSVKEVITPLIQLIGRLRDGEENCLGTCTLIANNLVLTTCHALEGRYVNQLTVLFGYVKNHERYGYYKKSTISAIVENNPKYDYAVLQITEPLGESLGFVSFDTEDLVTEPALLHYPLGQPLKVSVHEYSKSQGFQQLRFVTYHDSDYLSSGGAYFTPQGRMIAMHLGAELQIDTMNCQRYALPLQIIKEQLPNSILGRFLSKTLGQSLSFYPPNNHSIIKVDRVDHGYLIDEEGRESQKILSDLLGEKFLNGTKNILNTDGTIKFEKSILSYIRLQRPIQFSQLIEKCLGIAGKHGFTRNFSVNGFIESDHTIPHDVWKRTKNKKMKEIVDNGSEERKGEKDMPAITIPYSIHRELSTTGNKNCNSKFMDNLVGLCDTNQVQKALFLCLQDYKEKGLEMEEYKAPISELLDEYFKLKLITTAEKTQILASSIFKK